MTVLKTLFETPIDVRMSAETYLDDPRSEAKSDLIEGVFVMASPASFQHKDDRLVSQIIAGYWLEIDWLFPPQAGQRPGVLEVARLQRLI